MASDTVFVNVFGGMALCTDDGIGWFDTNVAIEFVDFMSSEIDVGQGDSFSLLDSSHKGCSRICHGSIDDSHGRV